MPNRIIKETICTSDNVDGLSWFQEVVFYRLMVQCDDFGRMDARPAILKARMFPLKENVTVGEIEAAVDKLHEAELIDLYIVNGKPFLQMRTWEKHQRIRAKISKHPSPEEGKIVTRASDLLTNDSKLLSFAPVIQSNPIQSESNPNPNPLIASKVVAYLNDKTNCRYSDKAKATLDLIAERMREGFTEEDFMTVIDKKAAEWMGTEWQKYLRPVTLFGDKFETYLNEEIAPKKSDKKPHETETHSFETDDFFAAALEKTYGGEI